MGALDKGKPDLYLKYGEGRKSLMMYLQAIQPQFDPLILHSYTQNTQANDTQIVRYNPPSFRQELRVSISSPLFLPPHARHPANTDLYQPHLRQRSRQSVAPHLLSRHLCHLSFLRFSAQCSCWTSKFKTFA